MKRIVLVLCFVRRRRNTAFLRLRFVLNLVSFRGFKVGKMSFRRFNKYVVV